MKQRKRTAQDRKEEEIEDGTEVNNEVNRNWKGRRKVTEKLRRYGKNTEMRNDRIEGWDEGSRRRDEGS